MPANQRPSKITRREFIHGCTTIGGSLALQSVLPAWARSGAQTNLAGLTTLTGTEFDLNVASAQSTVDGRSTRSVLINGHLPAPLLRWREGDNVTLRVTNNLDVDTSIHWHGVLLPYQMDGVPGVTFPGIKPRQTFVYEFPIRQAGTYWYHSHSGFQEQLGHYGPIIIEPKHADPVAYDREYVIVLSDWTFEDPQHVFAKLKKVSDVYNFQQRTLGDFFADVKSLGAMRALRERMMWGAMRMNPTDIADVTGATYKYLINGHSASENWTGLFALGESVRLRFINASAMSIFNVRIPDLPMTVVQADGLDVQPIEIDEFQIGTAETYDVIIKPTENQAYTLVAESNDRSGIACATLTPQLGLAAPIPPLRQRPTVSMKDMAMDHMADAGDGSSMQTMDRMDHAEMNHSMGSMSDGPSEPQVHLHARGAGVTGLAVNPVNRLSERPLGLEDVDHRVLVYTDLKSLHPNPDPRAPSRELELHLTSNMERYMWSFDGVKFSEVESPIIFYKDERLRLTLVNDTMMPHPIHLHGMFFDVGTGDHKNRPRKHTIVVKPGEKLFVDITADALGEWAFHCHLLYHMHAGMMRVVSVRDAQRPA
jgi:CopA family copper-resistance protein